VRNRASNAERSRFLWLTTCRSSTRTGSWGKLDAVADRKASTLRVHAIHEDVRFTRAMTKAVHAELDDLALWLGLGGVQLDAAAGP
jgi:uncharacterized protein YcaQ